MNPSADHLRKNAPAYAATSITANAQQMPFAKRGERTRRLVNQSKGGARKVKAMKASCREDIPHQHPTFDGERPTFKGRRRGFATRDLDVGCWKLNIGC